MTRNNQSCARPTLLESLEPRLLLSGEALWIEGEDFVSTTFNRHSWYQDSSVQMDLLSPGSPGVTDGAWLAHYVSNTVADSATATYDFTVAEGGTYDWWLRLNPFRNANGGAVYSYRIQPIGGTWSTWKAIDVSEARDHQVDLVDPGIDIRFIAWSFGDTLSLSPGSYSLQVELSDNDGADQETHGGIDVMALVNYPWAPTGILPPDPDAPAPGADDWFPLMSGPDRFDSGSIIDMSYLLEDSAGSHGALQRNGDDFQFADGTSVKFWGIDAGMAETVEGQERQAQFYAKYGINMIRQHPVEDVLGELQGAPGSRYFDPTKLDKWDRWFSILKDQGIYMTWSIFYHHTLLPDEGVDAGLYAELPDQGSGKDTYGKATFVQEYQDSQWTYADLLLNHVNPYTGVAYKDEPALAIVEARNEDSVFFHNPLSEAFVHGTEAENHLLRLRQMWHQWVADNYTSDTELQAAWGDGMRTNDSVSSDPVTEPMYMYAAWEMYASGPSNPAEKARMGDYIRFLAEMQRATYETYYNRLRGIGYQGAVVSTAWQAGGPAADAGNLWTDDAMDAIDRHSYWGGGVGGHMITEGAVDNESLLTQPGSGQLAEGYWQVEDKPFIQTEWTSKPPNQWTAEAAPLFAFYGMGLQDWDASYQFAGSRSYMGNGWPSLSSYVTETPHYIGQFPALAYAIHNGHVQEGATAAARRLGVDEIFQGFDALTQEYAGGGYDPEAPTGSYDTPAEVLAIGRLTAKVADGQDSSFSQDWSQFWDETNQVIDSNTGQLTWDYGDRVVTIHTDKTQGVIGFAGGGFYDLPGVTVDLQTEFVSLLFTPLDDQPLEASEHILITAMAQAKPYGAVYNQDGTQLLEAGIEPLMLEPVKATITFKGGDIDSARKVDFYGVPTTQDVERVGNTITIDGRYATYYYEVTRSGTPNTPPTALDDAYSIAEDDVLSVPTAGVLANDSDPDPDDVLSAVRISDPSHGLLSLNSDGSFVYTPDPDYFGGDSFTYTAHDGQAASNVATVNLTVTPVNDAPVAMDDSYSLDQDTTLVVPAPGVLGNDTDVETDPLTAIPLSDPSHGSMILGADGSFEYTPDAGYVGSDSFTYKANDGAADSGAATVNLSIDAGEIQNLAVGETTDFGTVSGDYTDTFASDDVVETIAEAPQGKKQVVEHTWTFGLPSEATTFSIEAWATGTEDAFALDYSTDGANWSQMLIVSKTVDDDTPQTYDLPAGISGAVSVRATDTFRRNNEAAGGALNVDHMFIASAGGPMLPIVGVTASDADASEQGLDPGTFSITRSGSTVGDLLVLYDLSGSATAGADYEALPGSATIPDGASSTDVTILPIDDAEAEGGETVVLTIAPDATYTIGSDTDTVTIADDDTVATWFYADGETTTYGSRQGSYLDTLTSDDVYESLTEGPIGPKSGLEHTWTIELTAPGQLTFGVEAYLSGGGESYVFQYSDDGSNWTDMLSVTKTADDDTPQTSAITESYTGTLYVRVVDTDRSPKETSLDTLFVDELYILSE
jgi:VCBS repeat-containing protein